MPSSGNIVSICAFQFCEEIPPLTATLFPLDCYHSGKKIKYLFFRGHTPSSSEAIDKSSLSQWYSAKFTVKDVTYQTAEHYMMAQKALLFDDVDSYHQIVSCNYPGEAKALGRKVSNFFLQFTKFCKFVRFDAAYKYEYGCIFSN